jgi:ABC-type oligopeptide transport system ATPase subunit
VTIQEQILELLLKLQKEFDLSMLFISHYKNGVERVCDRVIHMEDWQK